MKDSEADGWRVIAGIALIVAGLIIGSMVHKHIMSAWLDRSIFSETDTPGQFSLTLDYSSSPLLLLIPVGLSGVILMYLSIKHRKILSTITSCGVILVAGFASFFMPTDINLAAENISKNLALYLGVESVEYSKVEHTGNNILITAGENEYLLVMHKTNNSDDGSSVYIFDNKQ